MSTLPDVKSNSGTKKILVNLMLRVPIEIELDLSQSLSTEYLQFFPQEVKSQIDNCEEITIAKGLNLSNSLEDVLIDSSQIKEIVNKAIEDNQVLPSFPLSESETTEKDSKDKSLHNQDIEHSLEKEINLTHNSNIRLNKPSITGLVDLFNDGMVFTINALGTILFLGKIANYSWESETYGATRN
ncbi:hypothetical protein [Mastigocoleus testarum]|uniref:Uncharacterized protein n=1 Tax=Mastigocoleus testarum BC008 TaxID=371196 RepID=A0A0V7ZN03_9CYAN|nr:hypothetical protein [Mastigocoleus testarum]KST65783.1 hypothetical protein BC008_22670 [Mastigocoleus testarum BC008]